MTAHELNGSFFLDGAEGDLLLNGEKPSFQSTYPTIVTITTIGEGQAVYCETSVLGHQIIGNTVFLIGAFYDQNKEPIVPVGPVEATFYDGYRQVIASGTAISLGDGRYTHPVELPDDETAGQLTFEFTTTEGDYIIKGRGEIFRGWV